MNTRQAKRVTIMIDEDLDKKLRNKQSKVIQETQQSYSFSKALNDALRISVPKWNK